jgi:hypothetical protein
VVSHIKSRNVHTLFSPIKVIDSNLLQSLIGGVKTKLRAIADRGVLATFKK